jgi:hypothetical protein
MRQPQVHEREVCCYLAIVASVPLAQLVHSTRRGERASKHMNSKVWRVTAADTTPGVHPAAGAWGGLGRTCLLPHATQEPVSILAAMRCAASEKPRVCACAPDV